MKIYEKEHSPGFLEYVPYGFHCVCWFSLDFVVFVAVLGYEELKLTLFLRIHRHTKNN
jgi:hypothetical protein